MTDNEKDLGLPAKPMNKKSVYFKYPTTLIAVSMLAFGCAGILLIKNVSISTSTYILTGKTNSCAIAERKIIVEKESSGFLKSLFQRYSSAPQAQALMIADQGHLKFQWQYIFDSLSPEQHADNALQCLSQLYFKFEATEEDILRYGTQHQSKESLFRGIKDAPDDIKELIFKRFISLEPAKVLSMAQIIEAVSFNDDLWLSLFEKSLSEDRTNCLNDRQLLEIAERKGALWFISYLRKWNFSGVKESCLYRPYRDAMLESKPYSKLQKAVVRDLSERSEAFQREILRYEFSDPHSILIFDLLVTQHREKLSPEFYDEIFSYLVTSLKGKFALRGRLCPKQDPKEFCLEEKVLGDLEELVLKEEKFNFTAHLFELFDLNLKFKNMNGVEKISEITFYNFLDHALQTSSLHHSKSWMVYAWGRLSKPKKDLLFAQHFDAHACKSEKNIFFLDYLLDFASTEKLVTIYRTECAEDAAAADEVSYLEDYLKVFENKNQEKISKLKFALRKPADAENSELPGKDSESIQNKISPEPQHSETIGE